MKLHLLPLGNLVTNCYILADENTGDAIVVDAPDHADSILRFLKEQDYHLKELVLTHGHYDHILALHDLLSATGVPVAIHQNGKSFLQDSSYNLCHYAGIPWTPIIPDRYLKDGDTVMVGHIPLQVIHTPGHTSDSICLYGEDILISGDTLFQMSVGRTDLPTGSLPQEISSIKTKLLCLPDSTKVYPGHGPKTTIGNERKENPYLI